MKTCRNLSQCTHNYEVSRIGSSHQSKRKRTQVHASLPYEEISIPQSRDDMVQQAGAALAQRLKQQTSVKKKKGFKKSAGTGTKLAVELAVADDSPESVTKIAGHLLKQLEDEAQGKCILAFHDIQAALLASDVLENEISSLQDFEPAALSGILLVIGVPPMSEQENQAAMLMKNWRGSAAVWLSFGTNSFVDTLTPARAAFETIFAYEPVAAKGLIRTTEALIFKAMLDGKPSPWLLYKRSWGQYKLIGKTSQRPTASDLELALYNSSAAESPVVKGIKAFKAATSKQKR